MIEKIKKTYFLVLSGKQYWQLYFLTPSIYLGHRICGMEHTQQQMFCITTLIMGPSNWANSFVFPPSFQVFFVSVYHVLVKILKLKNTKVII